MDNLVFNILVAVIVAIIGIIAKELLPYIKRKKEEVTASLRKTQWAFAADIIDAVVRAVEQTVADDIHGPDKREVAVKYILHLLDQQNIHITSEQMDTLIEAAVQAMNQQSIQIEVPDEE